MNAWEGNVPDVKPLTPPEHMYLGLLLAMLCGSPIATLLSTLFPASSAT